MEGKAPPEGFPRIGTVEGPALFRFCESNLLLSYEIAPVDGGGNAILAFDGVVYFEQNPKNVPEGLRDSKYPVRAWDFTEVIGSDRNERWSHPLLPRRFWTISFNDWLVEVVFSSVEKVEETRKQIAPDAALLIYLSTSR